MPKVKIDINRKMLSEITVCDSRAFVELVEIEKRIVKFNLNATNVAFFYY